MIDMDGLGHTDSTEQTRRRSTPCYLGCRLADVAQYASMNKYCEIGKCPDTFHISLPPNAAALVLGRTALAHTHPHWPRSETPYLDPTGSRIYRLDLMGHE